MRRTIVEKVKGRVRRWICSKRLQGFLNANTSEVTRLGSSHGGWTLPISRIRPGGVAVLVGAGEDISFDVELNKRGIKVFTLDPTPRAVEHVRKVLASVAGGPPLAIDRSDSEFYDLTGLDKQRLTLLDVGLWNENTSMRFFAPKEESHVSHSIVNLQHTDQWFEAKCMTIRSVCEWQNITDIDILKLDIEGAEYTVLQDLIDSGIRPSVVCVEFDEIRNPLNSSYMARILDAIGMMKQAGYLFRHIEESNALFVTGD